MSDSLRPYGLTAAYQALLSMGFSRQEYWSGVPLPSPVGGHEHSLKLDFGIFAKTNRLALGHLPQG